ncbi:MAG: 6-pyruvoyl-tetrahydropterin synthase-related protein [Anaerolineae bacterium]
MKKHLPKLSWLAALLVMVPVIWPFISRDSLPVATDAELHIFRLAELERLVRGGEIYPRLAPNFYFGFGYPIFNYYSPFSYYLGVVIAFLPKVGPVEAVKTLFVLGLLSGGLGVFGFVRDRWGTAAGLLAAALYGTAPYIQYVDPHARGVLAESFSLGLLPLCLFFFGRLQQRQQKRYFLLSAFAVAAFVLSHNLMAMIGSGLLVVWLFSIWWFDLDDPVQRWTAAKLAPFFAFGLGIGMSMFFWIPVVLERNLVNLNTLVGEEGSHFSWSSHFLSLGELFALSHRIDWGASQSVIQFNLGFIQAVLFAALFVWVGWRVISKRRVEDKEQLFWLLIGFGILFFTLPVSTLFWRTIPVLPFVQFPWRFLGPAAIALAIGGGSLFRRVDWRVTGGVLALTLLFAVPLMQVAPWTDFGPTDLASVAFQEQKGRWLGTTSTADFIPATVQTVPPPANETIESLLNNESPDRVNRYSLPDFATAEQEVVSPLHFRYHVTAEKPFSLRLFLFDFPGWQVQVNNQPVEHQIGDPEGFIVISLQPGDQTVDVEFGTTPARIIGWMVSGLALIVLIGFSYLMPFSTRNKSEPTDLGLDHLPQAALGGLVVLVVITLLLPGRYFRYESADGVVESAEFPINVSLDRQIELLAYDLDQQVVEPGDGLSLTLYWQAEVKPKIDFQVFVHLIPLNGDGNIAVQSDKLNPGDFPTRRWTTDKYVTDIHQLSLPNDLPEGEYMLSAGLWVSDEGWRLPVLAADGSVADDVIQIETIIVGQK